MPDRPLRPDYRSAVRGSRRGVSHRTAEILCREGHFARQVDLMASRSFVWPAVPTFAHIDAACAALVPMTRIGREAGLPT
jgi:hypothetical protein